MFFDLASFHPETLLLLLPLDGGGRGGDKVLEFPIKKAKHARKDDAFIAFVAFIAFWAKQERISAVDAKAQKRLRNSRRNR
jgi:hypothetical protein